PSRHRRSRPRVHGNDVRVARGPHHSGMHGPVERSAAGCRTRIVSFVHSNSPAKICLQIGHSGRKGSTQLGWEDADHPLPSGNWEVISPSPIPYHKGINQVPREVTRADMDKVLADFLRSTRLGDQAGFDMLELHMAHGYLL